MGRDRQHEDTMNISASLVKELRDKTGAGMMDCKAALIETAGDMEAAVDWLRAKGLSKAAKKAGRVAADDWSASPCPHPGGRRRGQLRNRLRCPQRGLPGARPGRGRRGRGQRRRSRPHGRSDLSGQDHSVEAEVKELVATIGENMTFRRSRALSVPTGVVAPYVHSAITDGLGKIGVLVALESSGNADELMKLGRQIAMHVAATIRSPCRPRRSTPAVVERERAIFVEQAKESGKPAAVIEKMVEGRIRKFYEESTLLKQAFVINPDHHRRAGRQGRRGCGRGADQGDRLRALRARGRHREGRNGLRGRSSGSRRKS